MTKLDDILSGKNETNEEEIKNPLTKLYISSYALEKVQKYAKLAKSYDSSIECYGYLLGDEKRKGRFVDDVYFAPEQTNSYAHTEISGETVIKAAKEIKPLGKRVLGWWHSHGSLSTFHSGTDDRNLETVLNQVAPNNYLVREKQITAKLNGKEVKVQVPYKIRFAYSLVVNASGAKPYAEVKVIEDCPFCGLMEHDSEKIEIREIKYGNKTLDEAELEKEVKSKIIKEKPREFTKFEYKPYQGNNGQKVIVVPRDWEIAKMSRKKRKKMREKGFRYYIDKFLNFGD